MTTDHFHPRQELDPMNLLIPLSDREPVNPPIRDLCPHCRREILHYRFTAPDGHWLETHHCRRHGDVAPMRRVLVNPLAAA